jgi:hypothetical protein
MGMSAAASRHPETSGRTAIGARTDWPGRVREEAQVELELLSEAVRSVA